MKLDFTGKVAIVTGASSGIGRATALMFAAAGAKVVAAARREDEGQKTVAMIKEAGGESMFVRTDVSIVAETKALVDRTVAAYGRLDFAINNAGSAIVVPLTELTEEQWDFELARNLKGTAFGMKYQLPAIERSGGGAIVNCASSAGLRAPANYGAYAAAKGGVIALTRAVAAEGGAKNIRVNSIAIGTIETPAWRGSSESVLQGVRECSHT